MSSEATFRWSETTVPIGTMAAIECMAQLTRFVVRGQLTPEAAAKKAWDLAEALEAEGLKRADVPEREHSGESAAENGEKSPNGNTEVS